MSNNKVFRYFMLFFVLILGATFLYPSFKWYFLIDNETKNVLSGSKSELRDYILAQSDKDIKTLEELLKANPKSMLANNFNYLKSKKSKQYSLEELFLEYSGNSEAENKANIKEAIEENYRTKLMKIKDLKSSIIQLGLDLVGGINVIIEGDKASLKEFLGHEPSQEEFSLTMQKAIEILSNRIDQFGVSESKVKKLEGTNKILIELPGDNDPERVNNLLRSAGNLKLQIVDDEATRTVMSTPNFSLENNTLNLPVGTQVREFTQKDNYDVDKHISFIVTKETPENIFDGSNIKEASVSKTQMGKPEVTFILKPESVKDFANLTKTNTGKSMAIVLDGKVKAYASITREIGGGNVSIEGFSYEEAQSVATVLRTASLPIKLTVINQQTIGSTLSKETIDGALKAVFIGFILVLLIIGIYYKSGGLISDLALLINVFLLISILAVFNLTLTLTGIAGILLTIGMAVDTNIIIYERIKDEYIGGKSLQDSIQSGYSKAFLTILDSNITTFIAGLFLSFLTSGSIQGFAVTLCVGILTSMFSGLFVTKLFYDTKTSFQKSQKLDLLWGVRK